MKKTVLLLTLLAVLLTSCTTGPFAPSPTPTSTVTPTPSPTPSPTPTPTPSPTPTPTPTPVPTPTPTPEPILGPDVIGIYTSLPGRSGKHLLTEFTAKWVRGTDINTFNSIASHEESLSGSYRDILVRCWDAFENSDQYKIGYCLSYTLIDGTFITMTIRSPKDIVHTEYLEVYLYDSIHHKPGEWYSHLLENQMKDETLITSFKLTPGKEISQVKSITLKNFVYKDDDDFDPVTGEYTGRVSYEIEIKKPE